jgi:hypothetical protein
LIARSDTTGGMTMSGRIALLQSDGLNYDDMDKTTEAEIAAYRDFFVRIKGYSLPAHEFLLEFRPDSLKRYRHWAHMIPSDDEANRPLAHVMANLHYYAVTGYNDGILYEIRLSQFSGATKAEILDLLAVAALHGHPRGTQSVSDSSAEYLRTYKDSPKDGRWPPGWAFDRHAFDTGVDFSTSEATKQDIEKILDWYQTTIGEVPGYVRMLARLRPNMLKAYRNRYEHAIRDALPKQMLPFALLHWSTMRGFRDGIRENVLLARRLGMTRGQVTDAMFWGIYGGPEALSLAEDAAGDILDKMN